MFSKLKPLSPQVIEAMRRLGAKHTKILREVYAFLKPGISTMDVEEFYRNLLNKYGVKTACLGYKPKGYKVAYPAALCIGLNSDCVHTYPVANKIIKVTDLVVVDTVITDGTVYTDAAIAKPMPKANKIKRKIASVALDSLNFALNNLHANIKLGEIGASIYSVVRQAGYEVLREYGGHGIGTSMWMEPFVANYGDPQRGPILPAGIGLAIEPLVVSKSPIVEQVDDWATRLKDGGVFAHWEATVIVTSKGYELIAGLLKV